MQYKGKQTLYSHLLFLTLLCKVNLSVLKDI